MDQIQNAIKNFQELEHQASESGQNEKVNAIRIQLAKLQDVQNEFLRLTNNTGQNGNHNVAENNIQNSIQNNMNSGQNNMNSGRNNNTNNNGQMVMDNTNGIPTHLHLDKMKIFVKEIVVQMHIH